MYQIRQQRPHCTSNDSGADENASVRAHDVHVHVRAWQQPHRTLDEHAMDGHIDDGELAPGAQPYARQGLGERRRPSTGTAAFSVFSRH